MPEATQFALFVGAALALVTGGAVHVLAAVVGISALLVASPSSLAVLTWCGAGYLAWLGFRELAASKAPEGAVAPLARTPGQIYRQGVVVSVLNPKAVLFFMAFLPQFVRVDGVDPRLQVLALGGTFLALAVCTDTLWAVTAGRAGHRLRSPGRQRVRRWVSAAVYFALAVGAAWPRG